MESLAHQPRIRRVSARSSRGALVTRLVTPGGPGPAERERDYEPTPPSRALPSLALSRTRRLGSWFLARAPPSLAPFPGPLPDADALVLPVDPVPGSCRPGSGESARLTGQRLSLALAGSRPVPLSSSLPLSRSRSVSHSVLVCVPFHFLPRARASLVLVFHTAQRPSCLLSWETLLRTRCHHRPPTLAGCLSNSHLANPLGVSVTFMVPAALPNCLSFP